MKPETVLPRAMPEAMILLPLVPSWALALLTSQGSIEPVLLVGTVAVTSAMMLGRFAWRHAATGPSRSLIQSVVVVAACAVLWVWLQYALNPFRVRTTFDALRISRSAPWQFAAGVYLFGSVVLVATMLRTRNSRLPTTADTTGSRLTQLNVRIGDRTVLVDVRHIERIQASDDHVAIFTEGRQLIASYRLSDLVRQLDPYCFVRVHRSHIVNLSHVASIRRVDANRDAVVMTNGDCVTASRTGTVTLRKTMRKPSNT
jgi:DNA-binding LytR/AlgR family response regulator